MQYTKKSTLATYAVGMLLGGALLFTTSCGNSGSNFSLNRETSNLSSSRRSRGSFGSTTSSIRSTASSLFYGAYNLPSNIFNFSSTVATTFTGMLFKKENDSFDTYIDIADYDHAGAIRTPAQKERDEQCRRQSKEKHEQHYLDKAALRREQANSDNNRPVMKLSEQDKDKYKAKQTLITLHQENSINHNDPKLKELLKATAPKK